MASLRDQIALSWNSYFPDDKYSPQDSRVEIVEVFFNFFNSNPEDSLKLVFPFNSWECCYIDVMKLTAALPMSDFDGVLVSRPVELSKCLAIALSTVYRARNPYSETIMVYPHFYNTQSITAFVDVKASTVGQLICVEGQVTRANPSLVMVNTGRFKCAKCGQITAKRFEDGIYEPPKVCSTIKCYNKYLEFDKATATFETFQRVCLTEKSDSHLTSSDEHRLPRNLDIELRGGLVHTLQGGDNVKIWGLVKTLAQELPRGMKYAGKGAGGGAGGIRDSAVHVLYVLASSVVLLHSDAQYRVRDGAASVCLGEKGQEGGEGSRGYLLDQSLRNIKSGEGIPRGVGGTLGVSDFSTAEMKQIGEIALSNLAFPLFISLLCPRIYGQELVKGVIVLSLFGGTEKSLDTTSGEGIGAAIRGKDDDLSELAAATHKMREFNVRRNIHVLIGGDPGLGKSQLLRGGASLCPRSVVVSAMSASNAGLTVAMHREGGETVLEAGALVLADGGVCFIDELDKGGSDAGVALLEAMEQQSVSIAKGGVCTTLRTKCSVIAACNFGVDSGAKGGGSTKLSSALLSRFDLIFVLRDKQDADLDERVFQHIVNDGRGEKRKRDENDQDEAGGVSSNGMSLKGSEDNMRTLSHKLRYMVKHLDSKLPRAFLRRYRYLDYARRYVHPYLSKQACKVLQRHYLLMRGAGQRPGAEHSFSGVSTRQLESLIRLAQARAKVELRSEVTEQDALEVVQLMQESWMGEGEEFGVKQGEKGAKGGVLSMPKQMKALASLMQREVEFRGGNNVFHRKEIAEYHARLRLTKELDVLIEAMRTECYLLLKGPKLYQLQIV